MERSLYKLKYIEIISLVLIIIGLFMQQDFNPLIEYLMGLGIFATGVFIWFYKEEIVNKEKNNGN